MRWRLLLALGFVACQAAAPVAAPPHDDAATCKSDDDCSVPCGPCTSGDVIKASDHIRECVVNPCPNAVVRCTPEGTCRVK
jgi:hypothetical protein